MTMTMIATTMTDQTDPVGARARRLTWLAGTILCVQALCAVFFLYRILNDVTGLGGAPISWMAHELIELAAALGLILGVVAGTLILNRSLARARRIEGRLAELSGAFHILVSGRFTQWSLTPAEQDVAYFVLKGFSTAEIAGLRKTSEGTIKSQTAAIYRKAEVTGRAQLVSLFFDDLMDDHLRKAPAQALPVE